MAATKTENGREREGEGKRERESFCFQLIAAAETYIFIFRSLFSLHLGSEKTPARRRLEHGAGEGEGEPGRDGGWVGESGTDDQGVLEVTEVTDAAEGTEVFRHSSVTSAAFVASAALLLDRNFS